MPATARQSKSPRKKNAQPETIKTWVFDSVGNRKYAVQLRKARNGNPCLRLVEGVPQDDGSYRKFNITMWSEDFGALFDTLDEARAYIDENGIRTPDGHKWDPNKKRKGAYRKKPTN